MSPIRDTERETQVYDYVRRLDGHVQEATKLDTAIRTVIGPIVDKSCANFFYRIMALDKPQWRLLQQMDYTKLRKMQGYEIERILRRYGEDEEAVRSSWRRLCAKHKISTKPEGITKSGRYRRVVYLRDKGTGKTLDQINEMKMFIEHSMIAEMCPTCRPLMAELSSWLDRIIAPAQDGGIHVIPTLQYIHIVILKALDDQMMQAVISEMAAAMARPLGILTKRIMLDSTRIDGELRAWKTPETKEKFGKFFVAFAGCKIAVVRHDKKPSRLEYEMINTAEKSNVPIRIFDEFKLAEAWLVEA
jgi:hypothetical protein